VQIITLLTDFGLRDGYAGVMKGVIWGIAPHVQIVDIAHDVAPHDILEAARTLGRVVPYFPDGTIHVAVVDPGVGTRRRAIAAEVGRQFFVGPDNGLITALLEQAESWHENVKTVHLLQPRYWLPNPSSVFHGRDIFAPVAAHLSKGASLEEMGEFITDPVRLNMAAPRQMDKGWQGEVIHIDRFGNLATNIRRNDLRGLGSLEVLLGDKAIQGMVNTFGDGKDGELVALFDSFGYLSICVVNGSASERLGGGLGTPVTARQVS
jgi:S-adenosylmethionine hydrolase